MSDNDNAQSVSAREGEPSFSSVPHTETVGRPVSRSELPPDVQAKIERNRQAAFERRSKHQKRIDNEKEIAREFGEVVYGAATSAAPSSGGGGAGGGFVTESGSLSSTSSTATTGAAKVATGVLLDQNAAQIHKMMADIEPLPKNSWTKYYDYDLSKMKDTQAGFIQELDERDSIGRTTEEAAQDEENLRKRKWQPTVVPADPSIFLGAEDNYECQDCGSVDVDFQLLRHFHIPVCIACRDAYPDKYSLLTKTECRQDYLLTDPELRDTELFPFWERPNPKKATWNNMMLYLRCQVEEFAFKKWGGPEGLDTEFEKRERDKETRKEVKFKKELRDLRNKTRTSVWQDKKLAKRAKTHQHSYGATLVDPDTGASVQTCVECGIQVECEEF
ncbi:hypothetical protein CPC16_008933 [Podila verticillata]|nr:hypothetical protein BGZ52_004561 [Haplosporangium bisporale]KAF9395240.1 hypothetical protein CPC16_008933 [Podila verticillata]KAI9240845.1 MAG: XPA protein C-terminus-domain-containing protein [Podila humilis]KFH69096.1 hypothetical protein MVEG_05898 [Podila verticillata NRRL 6337]